MAHLEGRREARRAGWRDWGSECIGYAICNRRVRKFSVCRKPMKFKRPKKIDIAHEAKSAAGTIPNFGLSRGAHTTDGSEMCYIDSLLNLVESFGFARRRHDTTEALEKGKFVESTSLICGIVLHTMS